MSQDSSERLLFWEMGCVLEMERAICLRMLAVIVAGGSSLVLGVLDVVDGLVCGPVRRLVFHCLCSSSACSFLRMCWFDAVSLGSISMILE